MKAKGGFREQQLVQVCWSQGTVAGGPRSFIWPPRVNLYPLYPALCPGRLAGVAHLPTGKGRCQWKINRWGRVMSGYGSFWFLACEFALGS